MCFIASSRTLLPLYRAALLEAVEALGEMAKQKTLTEIHGDSDLEGGDFEYAYDRLVNMARETLAASAILKA